MAMTAFFAGYVQMKTIADVFGSWYVLPNASAERQWPPDVQDAGTLSAAASNVLRSKSFASFAPSSISRTFP